MRKTILATLVLVAAASAHAQTAQPQAQPQPQQPAAGTTQAPPSSGSSQQVVVNPPAAQQPAQPAQPQQPPPPGSSTTVVTPPPPTTTVVTPTQAERERSTRSPMATIAMDALYGGVAGLLVGGGVALINEGDNWGQALMIGAGSGILVGTAVGVVHAYALNRDESPRRVAFDGYGSTVRDPVIKNRPVFAIGGRF